MRARSGLVAKPVTTERLINRARAGVVDPARYTELFDAGLSVDQIAEELGVLRTSVTKALRRKIKREAS